MNIIFMGTPQIAVPTLKKLIEENDTKVTNIITQPDKKAGRGKNKTKPIIKILAEKHKIEVLQPKNKQELHTLLKTKNVDLFVVFAYGMIIEKQTLEIPKYGAINIHTSLLPQYRGASPIQQSLLNGDKETGITIIQINEKMDEGNIIFQKKVKINQNDNSEKLSKKLSELAEDNIIEIIKKIEKNEIKPKKQDKNKISYCKKIKKSDGKINWNQNGETIINTIRAFTPWPSAYTRVNSKKITILEATYKIEKQDKNPGKFYKENKELRITTKNGYIKPITIQMEGKRAMSNRDFLNGQGKTLIEKT